MTPRLAAHVLGPILASLSVACGGEVASSGDRQPPPPPTNVTPDPGPSGAPLLASCLGALDAQVLYGALAPGPGVDSIAFFKRSPGRWSPRPVHVLGTCDASCEATSVATAREVAAAPISGWPVPNDDSSDCAWAERCADAGMRGFAIVTVGAEVVRVTTLAALAPYLEPLRTVPAAQAWATLHFVGATCDGRPNAVVGDGFVELRRVTETCSSEQRSTLEALVRVYPDGRVDPGVARVIASTSGCFEDD